MTTYIARFDPLISWPADQSYTVEFNPKLEAFDGKFGGDLDRGRFVACCNS